MTDPELSPEAIELLRDLTEVSQAIADLYGAAPSDVRWVSVPGKDPTRVNLIPVSVVLPDGTEVQLGGTGDRAN